MKITVLLENTTQSKNLKAAHGLSLYIEAERHRLLFDLGENRFALENAAKLGLSVADADLVVLSHGHRDHGGALPLFLKQNQTAPVYIRETAFERHYVKALGMFANIGIPKPFLRRRRLIFTGDRHRIDDNLLLFSDVVGDEFYPSNNATLFVHRSNGYHPDDFSHEQNLIVSEHGRHTLIAGCAHRGILNIKKRAEEIIGAELDNVVSGFHLYNPSTGRPEPPEVLDALGRALSLTRTRYYTGHCTGEKPFRALKEHLGDRITALSTGMTFTL